MLNFVILIAKLVGSVLANLRDARLKKAGRDEMSLEILQEQSRREQIAKNIDNTCDSSSTIRDRMRQDNHSK